MNKLIGILLFFLSLNSFAASKIYYVANSGNDANNGLTPATAIKTIAKVNSLGLVGGDFVLFNRGDIIYGQLIVSHSGTSGNPITYGAYGTGANPVITGFTNVTSWNNLGGNIWESSGAVSTLATCNMVAVNGVNTAMGRTPNTGSYTYQSHTGTGGNITSNNLNSAVINWTGAELAMYVTTYTIGRYPITSQSGGTLNYTPVAGDENIQNNNQAFIIQNDVRTLDVQNEWYYNPSTKKIRIYSTASPSNVNVATIDTVLSVISQSYITIDGITFQGSNKTLAEIRGATHITIQNCSFNYAGKNGIHGEFGGGSNGSNTFFCDNNSFNNCNNNSIQIENDFHEATVTNNTVQNSGSIPFMIAPQGNTGTGISATGANSVISNNKVINSSYNGINFLGNNSLIQNNYVSGFNIYQTDGGGLYTGNSSGVTYSGTVVSNNIVVNGVNGIGIYFDDKANGIEVSGNTVIACDKGLYLHGTHDIIVRDNTFFNNTLAQIEMQDEIVPLERFSNITIKNNKLIALAKTQLTYLILLNTNYFSTLGILDSNYLARPIDDNLDIAIQISSPTYVYSTYNKAQWTTFSTQDANSKKSPIPISNVNQIYSYINPTDHDSTVSVINGVDITNTAYSGTTIIPAYSSLVLLSTGALITPVINWTPSTVTYPNGLGAGQLNAVAKDGATTVTGTMSYLFGAGYVGSVPGVTNTVNFSPADPLTYSNASKTVTIPVSPQSVSLSFTNLSVTYDGNNHLPTLNSTPNVATSILLDGVSGGKKDANTYTATGAVTDPNSSATPITATFTINKATATINAINTTVNYDGLTHSIPATTFPLGLNVTHTLSPVSALGTYTDTLKMVESNYQAAPIVRTITIVSNPAIIFISDTLKTYSGSAQSVTVTSAYSYTLTNGTRTNAGTQQVIATINDGVHTGADTANLVIAPKPVNLSWAKPANVAYGTVFVAGQLNATADQDGVWNYNYSVGQLVPPGTTTLIATFTPSSSNYSGGTITTTITTFNVVPVDGPHILVTHGKIIFDK